MASLPISKKDVITPYSVSAEEAAELIITSSNRASVARRGGFCFSMVMGVRPYNLLQDDDNNRYWSIATALAKNPYLDIPVYNIIESPGFAAAKAYAEQNPTASLLSLSVSGSYEPGEDKVSIGSSATNVLRTGQYVSFEDKKKLYQITRVSGSEITLSHPLIQSVSNGGSLNYLCQDHYGNIVDGVMGYFVNEDFGNPVSSVEDGILGIIGPLKFREKK